ncbi:histidine phosphatase family protein [Candidatus Woesearchaeota archaeon]|nr:histidine phosphatase family protein [Candidatus Woesearchaeota archaeon]
MPTITLIKTAPYGNLGKKELQYYANLSAQRISPALIPDAEEFVLNNTLIKNHESVQIILSSPKKRAIQTAKIIQKLFLPEIPLKVCPDLNEVTFSLDNLEEKTYSSTKARANFLHDFINDQLLESRDSIKKRIRHLFDNAGCNSLAVTHTFLMKIIQTLVKYPELFEKPHKIKRNFEINKRLFEYCDTLTLTDIEIKMAAKFI